MSETSQPFLAFFTCRFASIHRIKCALHLTDTIANPNNEYLQGKHGWLAPRPFIRCHMTVTVSWSIIALASDPHVSLL